MATDNPTATFAFVIPLPDEPDLTRYLFNKILFKDYDIATYSATSPSPTGATGGPGDDFIPSSDYSLYFYPNGSLLASAPPFVTDNAWVGLTNAPSGFLTGSDSVMPKLLVPSKLLVANGTQGSVAHTFSKETLFAKTSDGDNLFNWTLLNASYGDWSADPFQVIGRAGKKGASSATIKNKNDTLSENTVSIGLSDILPIPTGDWTSGPGGKLVVQGAFCLVLNVVPLQPGNASPDDVEDETWEIGIECGEVKMTLQEGGSLGVVVNDENKASVQLTEANAKEVPPQVFQYRDGTIYSIVVYPVWNGVVVASGIQDVKNNVKVASVYVPKTRNASIWDDDYNTGFDPENPAGITISVDDDVKINLSDTLEVDAKNCRFETAYVPLFFTQNCQFDTYWIANKDTTDPTITYTYNIYPIWTKNDTSTTGGGNTETWPNPDLGETQTYKRTSWQFNFSPEQPNRRSSELFGYYVRTKETREFEVARENGSFDLDWTGGTPGDPSPSTTWWKYVTNLSVTIGLDGSSGNITVDKYGLAGQDAVATQSIGAITITMDGPTGTTGGKIFSGIGMGIGESESSDGGTWTIPLVGLTKKMEDIVLINAPFFDGYKAGDVLEFLTKYSGIRLNLDNAPNAYLDSHRLTASVDLNTPVFDWKAGTSIADAMSQVMEDRLYWYFINKEGYVKVYELSEDDALPVYLGPNRKTGVYTDTKIVSRDLTPDFDDLRNEIVVISLREIDVTSSSVPPLEPLILSSSNVTDPIVPWSKGYVQGVPGVLTEDELSSVLDRAKAFSKQYEITGRVTIPGNANIEPYDQWGEYVIVSVTHNVDFQSKTWTTDIELAQGRDS